MKLTNNFGAPPSVVAAIEADPYSKDGADFSVTELIKPPQIRRLWLKHEHEISIDVREEIWKLLGKGVHAAIEQGGGTGIKEQRFHAECNGSTISGAIDLVLDGAITDYKITSVFSVQQGLKEDWERQLNLYQWLLRQNEIASTSLTIVAICRDWMKSRIGTLDYPQSPVVVIKVPVWNDERQDRYVLNRVRIHTQENTVPCTLEERWARGAFAVGGGKGRPKPFNSLHDATAYINGKQNPSLRVVAAKTKFIRCESWCEVAPFCPQWQTEKGEN
jgi:hypothetical protein